MATKVGRYEKDPKLMFNFTREKTMESIDVTLKRLKLEYVDVLQVSIGIDHYLFSINLVDLISFNSIDTLFYQ